MIRMKTTTQYTRYYRHTLRRSGTSMEKTIVPYVVLDSKNL
jgi:hypothetical protein